MMIDLNQPPRMDLLEQLDDNKLSDLFAICVGHERYTEQAPTFNELHKHLVRGILMERESERVELSE